MRTPILALMACLALAACKKDDPSTDGDTHTDPDTDTGTPASALVVEKGSITGVMLVSYTTEAEATVQLQYGISGEALTTEHPDTSTGTEHSFAVLGVKTGTDYDFQVVVDGTPAEIATERVAAAETTVPTFQLQKWQPELSCQEGGYLLLSYIGNNNSGIAILDRDADVVWSLPFPNTNVQLARVRPSFDGSSILYTTADGDRVDQIGEHVRQPLDGSAPEVLSTPRSHHDFVELPDGTIGWLDYAPFGPYSDCSPGTELPDPSGDVALDRILESPFGGPEVQVYDMWTDYPRTLNCDVDDESFLEEQDVFDLSHSNSIAYRASDDAYFHMSRWQDAFYKVDRSTGEFLWELGGQHSDFTPAKGQDPAELFNHSHMSEIWDGGLLVFNNNDFGPAAPGPSILQEYALDETNMTWEITWTWTSDQGFEALLGDVRRMPHDECDNLIVALSGSSIVREITRDGEFAWGLNTRLGAVLSRLYFIPDIYDLDTAFRD